MSLIREHLQAIHTDAVHKKNAIIHLQTKVGPTMNKAHLKRLLFQAGIRLWKLGDYDNAFIIARALGVGGEASNRAELLDSLCNEMPPKKDNNELELG